MNSLIERYGRQIIIPGWTLGFQEKLAKTTVEVSKELPSAVFYLAALGIGGIALKGELPDSLKKQLLSLRPDLDLQSTATCSITLEDKQVIVRNSGREKSFDFDNGGLQVGAQAVGFLIEDWLLNF